MNYSTLRIFDWSLKWAAATHITSEIPTLYCLWNETVWRTRFIVCDFRLIISIIIHRPNKDTLLSSSWLTLFIGLSQTEQNLYIHLCLHIYTCTFKIHYCKVWYCYQRSYFVFEWSGMYTRIDQIFFRRIANCSYCVISVF